MHHVDIQQVLDRDRIQRHVRIGVDLQLHGSCPVRRRSIRDIAQVHRAARGRDDVRPLRHARQIDQRHAAEGLHIAALGRQVHILRQVHFRVHIRDCQARLAGHVRIQVNSGCVVDGDCGICRGDGVLEVDGVVSVLAIYFDRACADHARHCQCRTDVVCSRVEIQVENRIVRPAKCDGRQGDICAGLHVQFARSRRTTVDNWAQLHFGSRLDRHRSGSTVQIDAAHGVV